MDNHDFDFLYGRWKVRNRRLKERLAACQEWLEFTATVNARAVWGGSANFDEYEALDTPFGEIHGLTLRLFDPRTREWSIYWANRDAGRLDVPMTGSWANGRGEFYDQELFEGRTIYARFIWTNESRDVARWEQAYSEDGGSTWETNWVMDLERVT